VKPLAECQICVARLLGALSVAIAVAGGAAQAVADVNQTPIAVPRHLEAVGV
jgi:hypothetical protein